MLWPRSWQATGLLRSLAQPLGNGSWTQELLPALLHLLELQRHQQGVRCSAAGAATSLLLPAPGGSAAAAADAAATSGRRQQQGSSGRQQPQQQQRHAWHSCRHSSSSSGGDGGGGITSIDVAEPLQDEPPAAASVRPLETVPQMLSRGGPVAQEAAATLAYLQDRVGLSQRQAEAIVVKLRNYGSGASAGRKMYRLRHPWAFTLEGDVRPVVELLLGVPGLDVRALLPRVPQILANPMLPRLRRNLHEMLEGGALALQGGADVERVLRLFPQILRMDLDDRALPLLNYLRSPPGDSSSAAGGGGGVGFSAERLRGIVIKYPAALAYPLARVQDSVEWLRGVGLTTPQLRTVLWKYIPVVSLSPETHERWRRWLLDLGVSQSQFPHIITRLPMVLTYSAEKRAAFVRFIREEAGLDQPTLLRVMHHVPDTMGRSLERLRANLEVMQRPEHAGLTLEQIRRLVRRNPGVLRLDLSSVTYAAKLRFLAEELWGEETLQSGAGQQRQQQGVQLQLQLQLQQQVGEAPAGEAEEAGDGLSSSAGGSDIGSWQEALIAHPFYISYRLDRIASRGCYLKYRGLPTHQLTAWLACTEEGFSRRFGRCTLSEYRAWLARWQASEAGRYWLRMAEERKTLMTQARLDLESQSDAAVHAATEAVLAAESAAAGANAARMGVADELLREQQAQEAQVLA